MTPLDAEASLLEDVMRTLPRDPALPIPATVLPLVATWHQHLAKES